MSDGLSIGVSATQMEFIESTDKFTLFCGGLGSGKTHAGALWLIKMALMFPDVKGLVTANSYSQLKKATLSKLFELLTEFGIPFQYKSQDGVIVIDGRCTIYAISMEKYDLLRGIEFGYAWGDECAFYKEDAFNVMVGRIRDRRGPCEWKGTTTPNGFNWLYNKFVKTPLKSSKVVYAKTSDNLANLSDNYFENLKEQYDSKLAAQELDGQFVNLTSGKVYYNFDRKQHVRPVHYSSSIIYMGLDFNVDPLCGVFAVIKNDEIHIFDELYLKDSNTFQASKEILNRYPVGLIQVIADETGNRRKTNSKYTDHEILRRSGLNVMPFANPRQKDRFNNVNRLFEKKKIFIDPKCENLIADLEQMVYDNKDDMLGHITDALGYLAWKIHPFKKPKRKASISYR